MLTILGCLLLAVTSSAPSTGIGTSPALQIRITSASPLTLRWAVRERGGTFTETVTETGAVRVVQTGGEPQFAEVACELDSTFAGAREEPMPTAPTLGLVVSEVNGARAAAFVVVGHGATTTVPTRGESPDRVKFFLGTPDASATTACPGVGTLGATAEGTTVSLRAQASVNSAGLQSHLAKTTTRPGPGVVMTTYFVAFGS